MHYTLSGDCSALYFILVFPVHCVLSTVQCWFDEELRGGGEQSIVMQFSVVIAVDISVQTGTHSALCSVCTQCIEGIQCTV